MTCVTAHLPSVPREAEAEAHQVHSGSEGASPERVCKEAKPHRHSQVAADAPLGSLP